MPTSVIPIISEWTFNFCEASLHKVILAMNILGSTPLCSDFRLQLCMAYQGYRYPEPYKILHHNVQLNLMCTFLEM